MIIDFILLPSCAARQLNFPEPSPRIKTRAWRHGRYSNPIVLPVPATTFWNNVSRSFRYLLPFRSGQTRWPDVSGLFLIFFSLGENQDDYVIPYSSRYWQIFHSILFKAVLSTWLVCANVFVRNKTIITNRKRFEVVWETREKHVRSTPSPSTCTGVAWCIWEHLRGQELGQRCTRQLSPNRILLLECSKNPCVANLS